MDQVIVKAELVVTVEDLKTLETDGLVAVMVNCGDQQDILLAIFRVEEQS